MRNLTTLAIAIVLMGAGVGMLVPIREAHRNGAARPNRGIELQLIQQGVGEKDQNLKLLLAGSVTGRAGRIEDPPRRDKRSDAGDGPGLGDPGS